MQGALAAGLLGGGSRYLGVTEDAGGFLAAALAEHAGRGTARCRRPTTAGTTWPAPPSAPSRRAAAASRAWATRCTRPVTRARRCCIRIADEEGLRGPHLRLFEAVGRVHPELLGRTLPLNGAGVCGAALCDLGFAPDILRGFALLARAAGLVGHIAEEMRRPVGPAIYDQVDRAAEYQPPTGG